MAMLSWFRGSWAAKVCPLGALALVPVGCSDADHHEVAEGEVAAQNAAVVTTGGLEADSYVRSGAATTNYGTATTILADGDDGGSTLNAYVRFSIGDVGTIASAKLRLYVTNTTAGAYIVQRVTNNAWDEATINWNNRPAVDGAVVTTFSSATSGTWLELDVTSVAQPNTTITLAIVPNGTTDGVDFSSRNATSNQPQVVVDNGTTPATTGAGGSGGAGGASGGSAGTGGSGGSTGGTAGTGGAGGTGGTGGTSSVIATDANLKIAFVGDTADGNNWKSVLALAQSEGAQAVVVPGDMTYDADPSGWWSATESKVGTSFPVFLARGNHDDSSWSGFLTKAASHLGGATRTAGPHDAAYKTVFHGLSIATIKKGDTATTVNNLFSGDTAIWKVCDWHQNQNKMQVGGKGDEMGWAVYEACRQKGAIIITGHEHTYHRTKTMTNTQTQTIDSTCASGSSLCVGPGRTFVTVVGTGGTGLRSQVRCTPTSTTKPFPSLNTSDTSCPIWASIYTTNQGANYGIQFITFNVDGNPKKARGYFKDIAGNTVDTFDITAD